MQKRLLFFVGVLGTLGSANWAMADAGDPAEAMGDEAAFQEPLGRKTVAKEGAIPASGAAFLQSRINNLEHRIRSLEEELRYMNERMRDLDRRVDDLRYRR